MIDKIICQAKHKPNEGCVACNGYGFVLHEIALHGGRKVWVRPGIRPIYIGKRWRSFDGLDCIETADGPIPLEDFK